MAIYFFTQAHLLNGQLDSQAFGPVVGDLEKKYRVCNLHTLSNDAIAYSVVKGEVKVQEITGTSNVNIILKPENPAIVEGLQIKYLIYRGIKKDSLIDNDIIAAATSNDLTANIWVEHQKMVTATAGTSNPITGNPSKNILGIDLQSLPGTDLIENLFVFNSAMVSPTIEAGKSIGLFDKTSAGFEIVMEGYFLDDTLDSVRAIDHIIDAGSFANTYSNKAIREKVTNYLDACAFYGYVPSLDINVLNSGAIPLQPSSADFFSQVIFPKFFNYNVLYIDLRNQSDLSFLYYSSNYDYKIFDLLFPAPTPTPITSNYAVNKWPVFTYRPPVTISTYIGDFTTFQFGFEKEVFEIDPILYFPANIIGKNFVDKGKRNFVTSKDYYKDSLNNNIYWITIPASKDRINISGVSLYINAFPGNGPIPRGIISSYIRIHYSRSVDAAAPGASTAKFTVNNEKDNLLPLKIIPNSYTVPAGKVKIYRTGVLNYRKIQIKANADDTRFIAGLFESFIAIENDRVTLFTLFKLRANFNGEFIEPTTIATGEKQDLSFFKYLESINKSQIVLGKHELKISSTLKIPFLNYTQVFDRIASAAKPFVFIAISLSRTEYDQVIAQAVTSQLDATLHPVFLQFRAINSLNDQNGVAYRKSQLDLRGLTQTGTYTNSLPAAIKIDVYSTEFLFSTKNTANAEALSITPYRATTIGNLRVQLSSGLQAALSNLSTEKQNLFNELQRLASFTKHANKIRAARNATTIEFRHSGTLVDALANTTFDPSTPDIIIITVKASYLVTGSPVAIVRTIIHEMIHASVDLEVYNILGTVPESITNAMATRLRAARTNPNAGIYASLFCKFGSKDEPHKRATPPPLTPTEQAAYDAAYIIHEREYSHNFMASYARVDIENAAIDYEVNNSIVRNNENARLKDIFSTATPPADKVDFVITKDMVYKALSWQGIERTREYRKQAGDNTASKQLFQCYSIIDSHEIDGTNYVVSPSSAMVGEKKEEFLPSPTPRPETCH